MDLNINYITKLYSIIFRMGNCLTQSLRSFKYIYNSYETRFLLSRNFDDLPMFGFIGTTVNAKVVEVYDGDTITIVFYYKGIPIKHRLRTEGYDSPELKPLKTIYNRDLHVRCGYIAKEYMSKLILNKVVKVVFNDKHNDKYGRLLGTIYDGNVNINQVMIDGGYGKTYDGGKKTEFSERDLLDIVNKGY